MIISRTLFQLLSFLMLASVVLIGGYVILSALFYFIGKDAFDSFQALVISSPVTYAVCASFIISLILSPFIRSAAEE